MIVNSHAHFFTFLALNTRRTRETLVNRLRKESWPQFLVDIFVKVFDEILKDENVQEEKLLRKLVGALRVDAQFKGLLDKAAARIPGEVGILLHGNLDAVAVGLLRRALARLFEKLGDENDLGERNIEDVLGFLYLSLQSSMEDVAEVYFSQTPENAAAVALMMDITKGGDSDSGRFDKQVQDTSTLALAYPGRILPFFAVHPDRKNCFERLRRAVEKQGFLGVKLYPSLGYKPLGDELKAIYQYCEANDLPLLMHCNQGGFFYTEDDIRNADPKLWKDFLKDHPKLRICFAHFGGDEELARRTKPESIGDWTRTILDLMELPGVYADVSFHVSAMDDETSRRRYFGNLQALIDSSEYGDRILWGSDFPLVRLRAREDHYWQFFQTELGLERFAKIAEANPARFLGLPNANGNGAGANVVRHIQFLAANKYSVKRQPEPWVDQVLRKELRTEVGFVVNPFGTEWTTHNVAHIYTQKALLVSRFPKKLWNKSFLDFGNMLIREIPDWPLEVESDANRADTFWKFAMELDATLRLPTSKNGPGAVFEPGVQREDVVNALQNRFRDASAKVYTFGNLIDSMYRFPTEIQLG